MIEKVILDYILSKSEYPAYMEEPKRDIPDRYYLIEKTGSNQNDRLFHSIIAVQSYAPTMYDAALLNDAVKEIMLDAIILPEVTRVRINSDYNFTDTETRRYRYQAVFDITHY